MSTPEIRKRALELAGVRADEITDLVKTVVAMRLRDAEKKRNAMVEIARLDPSPENLAQLAERAEDIAAIKSGALGLSLLAGIVKTLEADLLRRDADASERRD